MVLEQRFEELGKHFNAPNAIWKKHWDLLYAHYSNPQRKYHNLNHIKALFSHFDMHEDKLNQPEAVALAIFYHDVIYDVWSKTNEKDSADLATKHLQEAGLADALCQSVDTLIMATEKHVPSDNDTAWLIDFDINILTLPWEQYERFTHKIREEYREIPDEIYYPGRKQVLQHFIEKPRIFCTDWYFNQYEDNARHCLQSELKLL